MPILLILAAVQVFGPTVRLVPAERLIQVCPGDVPLLACTTFRETALTAQCQPESSGWRLHATAAVHPRVFTSTPFLMEHELAHVSDITSLLDELLDTLNAESFSSIDECEAAARRARSSLFIHMRRFQHISTLRRD